MNAKVLGILISGAAWALNLACPAVPVFVWSALITAVVNGKITLDHISEFMAAHGIKAFPEDGYPTGVNGQSEAPPGEDLAPGATNTNMTVGQ
jgi:hypothetical protein